MLIGVQYVAYNDEEEGMFPARGAEESLDPGANVGKGGYISSNVYACAERHYRIMFGTT